MAKQYYDGEVTMDTDWGGNKETGQLPVSGEKVQKFIKDSINSKVGYVGLVERIGQGYYVLARDEETFNEYKKTINDENPFGNLDMDGINGRFDAPFNYKMNINFIGKSESGYQSTMLGNTGNYVNFTAQTVDASDVPQSESVIVTIKIINESGVENTYTQIYDYLKASNGIEYNLDGKLSPGQNTIIVTAVGMTTGVSAMKRMTYRLVDMYFTDTFDITKRYQFTSSGTLRMNIGYSLKGVGTTSVRWFFDGNEYTSKVNTKYNNDPLISNYVEKFVFTEQTDTWLKPGVHSLQMIMECRDNNSGDEFKTPIYYREFIVENNPANLKEPFIVRKTSFDYVNEESIIKRRSDNETIPQLKETKQFDNVEFEYAAYYNGKNICAISTYITYPGKEPIEIYSEEQPLVSESFTNVIKQNINVSEIGPSIITIRAYYYASEEYKDTLYIVNVVDSDMKISTVTTDVALELNAFGRSNNSADKNKWVYSYSENGEIKEITTKFYENEYMIVSMVKQDGTIIPPDDATTANTKVVSVLPNKEEKEYKYIKFNNEYYIWTRGFDWSDTSGWDDNKLKLSNGNAITINYKPFSSDKIKNLKERGGTFEFEFETTNVYNDDAVICRIAGENNYAPGINIYASGAELVVSREIVQSRYIIKSITDDQGNVIAPSDANENNSKVVNSVPSTQNKDFKYLIVDGHYYEWFEETENVGYIKSVSTKYKSEESNRISFVITPDLDTEGYRDRILKIYVNGEICGAYPYDKGTNFTNGSNITFIGSEESCVNISSIKIYEKALTSNEILNNYIYYRNNAKEKSDIYKRNDIMLDDNDEVFNSNKLKSQLPIMTFYQTENGGSLDDIHQEKKNKKLTRFFDVVYIDIQNPSKNFLIKNAYVTPQGTSSMNYPVKNLRLYTGKKDDNKQYYSRLFVGSDIFIDGSHNNISWDNINLDSEVDKREYSFKDGSIPVNCWCLKADFAESSSSHNTGTARYWNGVLKNGGYTTKAQIKTEINKDKYPYDVRTCIDGFPIAVFYQSLEGSSPRFEGKYNFNNDKSTESVFGFTGGEELDEQEIKYFYIGKEKPIVNSDDILAIEGAYTETPNLNSPLYASDINGNWYMLRGKELLDNPKMECWELLNSVNEIALFKTMVGFGVGDEDEKVGIVDGENFDGAFESRYPDCGDYFHTNSLRRFGEWLVSCRYLDIDNNTGDSVPFTIVPSENYYLNEDGKLSICSLSKKTGEFEFNFPNYNFYKEIEYETIASNIKKEGYQQVDIKNEDISTIVYKEVDILPTEKDNDYEYIKCDKVFWTWMPSNLLETNELPSVHETSYDYILVEGRYYAWNNKFKFEDYHPVEGTIDTPNVWVDDNAFNRALKFAVEKYDHIEMNKMAAYYIYLMRFGGVDQTVKNSMLTTEGPNNDDPNSTLPSLWYFINYDNDTILGVKNDGHLVFDPYITRQTKDGTGYVYAGRESTLWNNLEEDKQFMDKVTEVDNKLANGSDNTNRLFLLSYDNAIREYDTNQSDKWCERIYNKDAERKYIQTYVEGWTQKIEESNTETHVYEDYLYDVQGSRSAHRKWWLGRRFNLFDSRFCNANFKSQLIKFRSTNLPSGSNFTIKSGEPIFYAWGHDNSVTEITQTAILPGNTCTFTTKSAFNIGSYLEVMGSANISSFDLRNCVGALTEIDINGCYSHTVGTKLKELLVGDRNNPNLVNISNTALKFSGLDKASKLEVLDMTNIRNVMSFDGLNKLLNIRKVYAKGTSVSSFEFANGSMIERIELPTSVETLKLDHSALLKYENIIFDGNNYGNLINLTIDNCSKLMEDHTFVLRWISKLSQVQKENIKLNLLGIKWTIKDEHLSNLLSLENVGTSDTGIFNVTGEITIPDSISNEQAVKLQKIFGENCFKEGSALYIRTEPAIFINMDREIWEGSEDVRCNIITIGSTLRGVLDVTFSVYDENDNKIIQTDDFIYDLSNINNDYVLITVKESNNTYKTLNIVSTYYPDPENTSRKYYSSHNCDIHKRKYPQNIDIYASKNSFNNTFWNEISLIYTPNELNTIDLNGRGFFDVSWEIIDGTNNYQNYITLRKKDTEKAEIKASEGIDAQVTVKATITRLYDNTIICTNEKVLTFTDPDTILTQGSNPELFKILVDAEIIKITEGELPKLNKNGASRITINQLKDSNGKSIFAGKNLKSFLEFEFFTDETIGGLDTNNNPLTPTNLFSGCASLTEIALSANFKYSTNGMFSGCTSLERIYGPSSQSSEQQEYTMLRLIDVAENFANGCKKLIDCKLASTLEHIGNNAFKGCTNLSNFTIPSNSNLIIDINSSTTPFAECPNITFNGTSYNDPGTIKYCVNDGCLYKIIDNNTAKLLHMGKNSLMVNIPNNRTIQACSYSMESRTENSVIIPENVVIENCTYLFKGSLGNSITLKRKLGANVSYLFAETNFNGNYYFASNETVIPAFCFYNINNLNNEYNVPGGITYIGDGAFTDTNIKKIILPDTLTGVGEGTIYNAKELEAIIFTYKNSDFELPEFKDKNFTNNKLTDVCIPYKGYERIKKGIETGTTNKKLYFYLRPSHVYETGGTVTILSNGNYLTDENGISVMVGGFEATYEEKNHYWTYKPNNDNGYFNTSCGNIDITVYSGDTATTVGIVLEQNTKIFIGDNSSLNIGDGFDFTKGLNNIEDTLSEKDIKQIVYNQKCKGIVRRYRNEDSTQLTFTGTTESMSNLYYGVDLYTTSNKRGLYVNGSQINESFTFNKEMSLNGGETINIEFVSPANKHGINSFVINKIGNPVYSDPINENMVIADDIEQNYKVISIKLNAPVEIPKYVHVSVVEEKNIYEYRKFYNEPLNFIIPNKFNFTATSTDFTTFEGKEYKLRKSENVVDNIINLYYDAKSGIEHKGNVLCFYSDFSDWYINLEKMEGKWGSILNDEVNVSEIITSNANGLKNTLILSNNTNSIFDEASKFRFFENDIIGYIPSYIEIEMLRDHLHEINNYLKTIGKKEIDLNNLWTSESFDDENAYNSNGEIINKTETLNYYIFGRKINSLRDF